MVHYVYRLYNGHGRLLYVGASKDPWSRFRQHRQERPHMTDHVRRGRISVFATELDAKRAEREAIITEQPVFNLQYRHPAPHWQAEDFRRYVADLKAQPNYGGSPNVHHVARMRAASLAFAGRFGEPMGQVRRTNARTARP